MKTKLKALSFVQGTSKGIDRIKVQILNYFDYIYFKYLCNSLDKYHTNNGVIRIIQELN